MLTKQQEECLRELGLDARCSFDEIHRAYVHLLSCYGQEKASKGKEHDFEAKRKRIEEAYTTLMISRAYPPTDFIRVEELTLEEIYSGKSLSLSYKRKVICQDCKGRRSQSIDDKLVCSDCNGSGRLVKKKKVFQIIFTCRKCEGEGIFIKEYCKTCSGSGATLEKYSVSLDTPKGVRNNQIIRIPEAGHFQGSLLLVIRQLPHTHFTRFGNDLEYKCNIMLKEALCGFELNIPTLSGETIRQTISEIISPGQTRQMPNKGMPFASNPNLYGHMFIRFTINFPEFITPEAKAELENILPDEILFARSNV